MQCHVGILPSYDLTARLSTATHSTCVRGPALLALLFLRSKRPKYISYSTSPMAYWFCCFAVGLAAGCSLSRASDPACKRCVQGMAIGLYHVCVMLYDGSIECAGDNEQGLLWRDEADGSDKLVPASALTGINIRSIGSGDFHCCILTTAPEGGDKVLCVGRGKDGELGDGSLNSSTVPVAVQGLLPSRVTQLAVGAGYTCVLYADPDKLVQCWGVYLKVDNYIAATAIPGTAGARAVAVSTSDGHSCAVTQNSTILCWYTGTESWALEGLQNAVRAVALGYRYGCAIAEGIESVEEASVWCWKTTINAEFRPIVMANTTLRNKPRKVMGLPPGTVVELVAGDMHACDMHTLCDRKGCRCSRRTGLLLGLQRQRAIGTRVHECHVVHWDRG